MTRNLSTLLLAVGVFAVVALGAFMITTAAFGDDEADEPAPGSEVSGEQRVLFSNLGMG